MSLLADDLSFASKNQLKTSWQKMAK